MKKFIIFLLGTGLFLNCAHLPGFNRTTVNSTDFSKVPGQEAVITDSTQIVAGMSMSQIRQIFGDPTVSRSTEAGFVIWKYATREFVFVDDVLINWREPTQLKFESTQF